VGNYDVNVAGMWAESLDSLSQSLTAFSSRLNEADRVSQYSSGLSAMDRAFSTYNRSLKDKRWAKPADTESSAKSVSGESGASAQLTLGQIDEQSLTADHAALISTQRDFIRQNFRNKAAQEQLLSALEQRSVQHYDQVWELWSTETTHRLIADSDQNITYWSEKTDFTPEQRMQQVDALLQSDVNQGLRRADDAAAYSEKVKREIESAWAVGTALEQAKAAGWNMQAADAWLDSNTTFWDLDPTKREAARNVVRQRVEYEQQEQKRINEEYDAEQNRTLEDFDLANYDNIDALRGAIKKLPEAQFRIAGHQTYWQDRWNDRVTFLTKPLPVDKGIHDDWQKANASLLLTQLVQAQADGVQPQKLRKMIDEYNVVKDPQGNVIDYRITGSDLQKLYKDFVDPSSSVAYKEASSWIVAYAKEKKLSQTATEDLVARWTDLYRSHPDASEDEMRRAAEALATPIARQDLERMFNKVNIQAIFGDAKVLTTAEQALLDVQERGFTWRSTEPENLTYLQQLAQKWLGVGQGRYPTEGLVRAEPDINGYYGVGRGSEGIPLLYNEAGDLYRFIIEGKEAVLQKLATWHDGTRAWEAVTQPAPAPSPAQAATADAVAASASSTLTESSKAWVDEAIARRMRITRRALRDADIDSIVGAEADRYIMDLKAAGDQRNDAQLRDLFRELVKQRAAVQGGAQPAPAAAPELRLEDWNKDSTGWRRGSDDRRADPVTARILDEKLTAQAAQVGK
jgi:hypothetical protein